MKRKLSLAALMLLVSLCLSCAVMAGDPVYCFSESASAPDGIILTKVPEKQQGGIYLGSRRLLPGDVVPGSLLGSLYLKPEANTSGEATLVFCPIEDGHVAETTALRIPFGKKENLPPQARDSKFETYKNIENTGTLDVTEPEGESFTASLTKEPKRGTVTFDGGSFTYTPIRNKVGKDSFSYTVTDPAGNVSEEATVEIQILKPSVKGTYADMLGDKDEFAAVWLKEQDLFTGEQVAQHLCFCPEKAVTRGEFLAMTMKLLNKTADETALSTGFADEKDTPSWLQPYLVTALRSGMISGDNADGVMVFRPTSPLTAAEAAVMLQNTLELPAPEDAPVFAADSTVPVWARNSYSALACAGIDLSPTAGIMTRRDAARLLYEVSALTN